MTELLSRYDSVQRLEGRIYSNVKCGEQHEASRLSDMTHHSNSIKQHVHVIPDSLESRAEAQYTQDV